MEGTFGLNPRSLEVFEDKNCGPGSSSGPDEGISLGVTDCFKGALSMISARRGENRTLGRMVTEESMTVVTVGMVRRHSHLIPRRGRGQPAGGFTLAIAWVVVKALIWAYGPTVVGTALDRAMETMAHMDLPKLMMLFLVAWARMEAMMGPVGVCQLTPMGRRVRTRREVLTTCPGGLIMTACELPSKEILRKAKMGLGDASGRHEATWIWGGTISHDPTPGSIRHTVIGPVDIREVSKGILLGVRVTAIVVGRLFAPDGYKYGHGRSYRDVVMEAVLCSNPGTVVMMTDARGHLVTKDLPTHTRIRKRGIVSYKGLVFRVPKSLGWRGFKIYFFD